MAEITFTIDPATGKLDVHVKGVRGPGCADVAKLVEELLGPPQVDHNTAEYYLRTEVRPQIRPKRQS
jgi:hypothetical protein